MAVEIEDNRERFKRQYRAAAATGFWNAGSHFAQVARVLAPFRYGFLMRSIVAAQPQFYGDHIRVEVGSFSIVYARYQEYEGRYPETQLARGRRYLRRADEIMKPEVMKYVRDALRAAGF